MRAALSKTSDGELMFDKNEILHDGPRRHACLGQIYIEIGAGDPFHFAYSKKQLIDVSKIMVDERLKEYHRSPIPQYEFEQSDYRRAEKRTPFGIEVSLVETSAFKIPSWKPVEHTKHTNHVCKFWRCDIKTPHQHLSRSGFPYFT